MNKYGINCTGRKLASVLGFLFAAIVPAHAGIIPTSVDFTINGQDVSSTDFTIDTDALSGVSVLTGSIDTSDYVIDYSVTADSDPYLTYGFLATNITGAPLTVSHHFSTPVVGGPYNTASASLSISATPGFSGGFGLTPTSNAVADAYATGLSTFDLGVDLGGSCPALTQSGSCYAVRDTATYLNQNLTELDEYIGFTLTGQGSQATVNGRVSVTEGPDPLFTATVTGVAPEPGSIILLGGALCFSALLLKKYRFARTN